MHVTVAYSRQPVDWMAAGEIWFGPEVKVEAGGPRLVEPLGDDGLIVLLFASDDLKWRWQKFRDIGATWDHPEYQPHVSFAFSTAGAVLSKVQPYNGPLVFGPERFAEIDEGWRARAASDGGGPEGGAPFVEDARWNRRDRLGRFTRSAAVKGEVASFQLAIQAMGQNRLAFYPIGTVRRPAEVSNKAGLAVLGFKHAVTNQGLQHSWKNHGPGSKEPPYREVQQGDWQHIPDIVLRPDSISPGVHTGAHGQPRIVFRKKISGVTYEYVAQASAGKRRLDMWSFYRV